MRQAPPNCLFYFIKLLRWKNFKTVNPNGKVNLSGPEGEHSFNNCSSKTTIGMQKLIEVLINVGKYPTEIAEKIVLDAIKDGLLVPTSKTFSKLTSLKTTNNDGKQLLRFPFNWEIKRHKKDLYCFECHLPGFVEHCHQCHRSFHKKCYRRNPLKPNYAVPSSKNQKHPLPEFNSDNEELDEEPNSYERSPEDSGRGDSLSVSNLIQTTNNSSLLSPATAISSAETSYCTNNLFGLFKTDDNDLTVEFDNTENSILSWENCNTLNGKKWQSFNYDFLTEGKKDVDLDYKTRTTDVVYLGEIRPPNRKRNMSRVAINDLTINDGIFMNAALNLSNDLQWNLTLKNESPLLRDEDQYIEEQQLELKLCTCCRLMRISDIQQPPNLDADELCYLIDYTFKRNRTWIKYDLLTYLKNIKMAPDTIKFICDILLVKPIICFTDIELKIQNKNYNLLIDFLIDLLDIQHQIGVFFGDNSLEFDATKWLIRDITHDISEIRRCPDCFRYSSEKNSCYLWFAKPCFQRHELVFAKQSGFSYWPAKVMRVLHRNNNTKYDVRFFGGNHSRALVDAQYIRAIDTDIKQLNLGKGVAIRKALEELHYHQLLAKYSSTEFSFNADPQKAKLIIDMISGGNIVTIGEEDSRPTSTKTGFFITSTNLQTIPETSKRRSSRQRIQILQRKLEMKSQLQRPNQYSMNLNYHNNINEMSNSNNLVITCNENAAVHNFQGIANGEQQSIDNSSKTKKNNSNNKRNCYRIQEQQCNNKKNTTYSKLKVNVKRLNVNNVQNLIQSIHNHGRNNIDKETMYTLKKLKIVEKELEATRNSLDDLTSRNMQLENQLNRMKKLAKQQIRNIKSIKRNRWCSWCLEKAAYSCCFEASYCSDWCQKHDWIKGHSKICRILRKFANSRKKIKN